MEPHTPREENKDKKPVEEVTIGEIENQIKPPLSIKTHTHTHTIAPMQ